jgi:restriction endonuclease S subunit
LSPSNWKDFKLGELFEISGSKRTPITTLKDTYGEGKFPYVTTQATNNGIGGFFNFANNKGNVLTIDSAVVGYCSYQELDYSASDHVERLEPKFKLNKYIALFLTTIINKESYRYNYGRKANQGRIKDMIIKLPFTTYGEPDFEFMENYVKSLPYSASL